MFLLAGLGNKGKEYQYTRHNIGFISLDIMGQTLGFSLNETEGFSALIFKFLFQNNRILSAKPQTFMNLSGDSIQKICSFYKIPIENVFVFHDDIDLPCNQIKFKTGGGSGGHNGLKSLDSCIGKEYNRIRIGVGRPNAKTEISNYVLSNFSKKELQGITFKLTILFNNLNLLLEKKFSNLSQLLF